MPRKGQVSITVREDLVEQIKPLVNRGTERPHSVAEFVTVAVREKIERMKKEA